MICTVLDIRYCDRFAELDLQPVNTPQQFKARAPLPLALEVAMHVSPGDRVAVDAEQPEPSAAIVNLAGLRRLAPVA
ncbi:MAG: hypothetical protein EBR82_75370 [Caulobacteraceae bacterium]|nr:hypothetical protein [Caulobacteraceae bacterium]